MNRDTQYATTDHGVRIAYRTMGAGRPVLLARAVALSFEHEIALQHPLLPVLSSATALTVFDMPGTGLSQRGGVTAGLEEDREAIEAVARQAFGDEAFTLVGVATGCAGAAAFAAAHPDAVDTFICINPAMFSPEAWPVDFLRGNWSMARRIMAARMYPDGPVERQRSYGRAVADSISHEYMTSYYKYINGLDVPSLFARVDVPVFYIQNVQSTWDRERLDAIIKATKTCEVRVYRLPTGIMPARDIAYACLQYMGLTATPDADEPPTETAIIMFADIASSTELTERLGDARFRAAARELDDALRQAIAHERGTAIDGKLLGDGVLATFPSAAHAVRAALRSAEEARGHDLLLHLAVHAGDVIREQTGSGQVNVFGGAVNIAARISALCEPGDVLVSDIVRGLARTSAGVTFEDHGAHTLRGVSGEHRLYRVRAQE